MSNLLSLRFDIRDRRAATKLALSYWIAYILVFFLVNQDFGFPILALSIIPLTLSGFALGPRRGLIVGLLNILLNTLLFGLAGRLGGIILADLVLRVPIGLFVPIASGWFGNLYYQLQERSKDLVSEHAALQTEIVERRKAEAALRQAHDDLELRVQQRTVELAKSNTALQAEITERKREAVRSVAFASLGRWLNATSNPKEAAKTIVEVADNLLGWDACFIELYSAEQDRVLNTVLSMDIVEGKRAEVSPVYDSAEPTPILRRVIDEGGQLILREDWDSPRLIPFGDTSRRSASLMFVPIRNGAKTIGVLSIQSYTPNAYDKDALDTLQALADHCGGALERMRAEKTLREREEHLRLITDNIIDMVCLVNSDGISQYASPAYRQILGYAPEEMLGKSIFQYMHPEDAERVAVTVQTALQTGSSGKTEFRYRHADGHYLWLETTGKLLVDDNGSPNGAVLSGRDITARRQAEETLRHNRDLLLALSRAAQTVQRADTPDQIYRAVGDEIKTLGYGLAIFLLTDDGVHLNIAYTTIAANMLRMAEKLTHLPTQTYRMPIPPESIFGRIIAGEGATYLNSTSETAAQVLPKILAPLANRLVTMLNVSQGIVAPLRAENTTLGVLAVTSSALAESDVPAVETFAAQVAISLRNARLIQQVQAELAERKRADEALRASEAKNRALIDAIPDLIFRVNNARILLDVKLGKDFVTALPPSEFIGMDAHELMKVYARLSEENIQEAFELMEQALLTGKPQALEFDVLWDDVLRYYEARFVQSGNDEIIGIVRDVSNRKRTEMAEREQRALAEALRDTAAALNSTLDFDQVLDRILVNIGRVVSNDAANVMLIDADIATIVRAQYPTSTASRIRTLGMQFPLAEFPNLRQMVETKQPVIIADTETDPAWKRMPRVDWIRSYIGTPIVVNSQVIGFLNLDSNKPGFFTTAHIANLIAFADQAAVALENARLLQKAKQRADQFLALYETTRDLSVQQDLPVMLKTVVDRATTLLHAPSGFLYLYDAHTRELTLTVMTGLSAPRDTRIEFGKGIAGRVALTNQPMIVDDYQTWEHRSAHYLDVPYRSIIEVPMNFGGDIIGVLGVNEFGESERKFNEEDEHLLSLFAGQAASAVHNVRLFEELQRELAERTRVQKTLVESEHRYRTLFENVPSIIYSLSSDGCFTMLNPAFEHITGWSVSEWLGKPFEELLHPASRDYALQEFGRALQRETANYTEMRLLTKMGDTLVIEILGIAQVQDGKTIGVTGFAHDITERKRIEEALQESEARHRIISDMTTDFAYSLRTDRESPVMTEWFGGGLERLTGYTPDELNARGGLPGIIYPEDAPIAFNHIQTVLNGQQDTCQFRIITKSGDVRWNLDYARPVWDESGRRLICIHGAGQDITARKHAEEALRGSEDRYRDLVEHSRELMCTHDLHGWLLSVNPAALKSIGYPEDVLLKMNLRDLLAPEVRDQFEDYLATIQRDGVASGLLLVQNSQGERRMWDYYNTLRAEGLPTPIVRGMAQDITERKRAEEALQRERDFAQQIMNTLGQGVTVTDSENKFTYVNPAYARMIGVTPEELIGKRAADFTPPEDQSILAGARAERQSGMTTTYEIRLRRTNGEAVPVLITGTPYRRAGKVIGAITAVTDLTEQKRAEQDVRDSEERLRALVESTIDAIISADGRGNIISWNKGAEEMFGYREEEILGRSPDILFAEFDVEGYREATREGYATGEFARFLGKKNEACGIRKDGSAFPLELSLGTWETHEGKFLTGIVRDITERKQAQEMLQATQEFSRNIIDSSLDMIIAADENRRITEFNRAAQETFGYTLEDILGQDVSILYADLPEGQQINRALIDRGRTTQEVWNRRKNGEVFPCLLSASVLHNPHGEPIGFMGVSRDITESKRAEEMLRASQARNQALVDAIPDTMVRVNRAGTILDFKPGAALTTLRLPPDFLGKNAGELIQMEEQLPRDILRQLLAAMQRAWETGTPQSIESQFSLGDVPRYFEARFVVSGADEMLGIIRDITERKRTEDALRESEKRFSTIFHASPVAISLRTFTDGRCIDVNEAYLRLSGFQREEVIDHILFETDTWQTLADRQELVNKLAQKQYLKNLESEFQTKSGQCRHVLASYEKIQLGGEDYILALFHDITERKQAEEELAQSHEQLRAVSIYWQNAIEAQRAHIAREIHDEFGQSMSALKMDLTWLANRLPEGDERIDRIHTMTTLVDGSIALMRRIATELRPGLLDDLGLNAALDWQAREFSRRCDIPCNLELPHDDLALDPALNTALFRIFQEALTNVLRHAQATRVDARFQLEGTTLILTVQDNGRGIKESELKNPHSLGLLGLRERATQWGGDLTIRGTVSEGTIVTVRIPHPASPVNGGIK